VGGQHPPVVVTLSVDCDATLGPLVKATFSTPRVLHRWARLVTGTDRPGACHDRFLVDNRSTIGTVDRVWRRDMLEWQQRQAGGALFVEPRVPLNW
jgi:hypothetical protein